MGVGLLPKLRDYIRHYDEEIGEVSGVETKLGRLSTEETELLARSVETLLWDSPECIKECIKENFELLIDLVRSVKLNSHSSYMGIRSKEKGLQLLHIDPTMFDYVWGSTDVSDWSKTIDTAGVYDFIGTRDSPVTTAEEEGYIIFGFVDLACRKDYPNAQPSSPIKHICIVKDARTRYYQSITFEYSREYPFCPLEEPLIVLPESSFYIRVKTATGTTHFAPVGFKICMRTAITAMFE